MLAIRFLSTITAHSTILASSLSLVTFASTTKAFRIAHQGNRKLLRRQQPLTIWSKGLCCDKSKKFAGNTSTKLLFSNLDTSTIGKGITMAKKRKSSSLSTAATRRGTRSRMSKTDSIPDEPIDSNNKVKTEKAIKTKAIKQPASYRMLMILSPAKTLNLEPQTNSLPIKWTKPLESLQGERTQVVSAVKGHAKSATKLGALLKTSKTLTTTAQSYWKAMSSDAALDDASTTKPSILTFDGAAYSGLNVRDTLVESKSNLGYLQDHLRIVDPLYGWLRPMDAIEAYRLEMASKGVFPADVKLKLEDYWRPGIEACLSQEENTNSESIVVVNLASDEYSAAMDQTKRTMVKIVFQHGGRTIAVHAKRARGLMVRFAALHNIQEIEGLKAFDLEGYSYQPEQSTYDDMGGAKSILDKSSTSETNTKAKKKKLQQPTLVFDRPGTWKKPK